MEEGEAREGSYSPYNDTSFIEMLRMGESMRYAGNNDNVTKDYLYQCCDGGHEYGTLDSDDKGKGKEKEEDNQESEKYKKPSVRISDHWNGQFQALVEEIRDQDLFEERAIYRKLSRHGQDFLYAAKMYGRIIISERYLPDERKSFKPADSVGGKAGGEKYIVHNILFKFAVDTEGIYGGNDHFAAKVAGHELKSLMQVFNCNIPSFCFPMLCLVDYLGFRLLAISLLPIGKDSLVYGSCDAGQTVKKTDSLVISAMKQLGKTLNLKSHRVGFGPMKEQPKLYTPVDFECHRGDDGRYYLLDFSRLMPPEAPGEILLRGQHLAQLLRPELVKSNPVPLSSDAFSRFGFHDHEIHNKEVREATKRLHEEVIPKFAAYLDSVPATHEVPEEKRAMFLEEQLHLHGINCRHLGVVKRHVRNTLWHKIILTTIIARTIKNILKEKMREAMKEIQESMEQPYREVVLGYLNVVFGCSKESSSFWMGGELKVKLETYFPGTLSEKEKGSRYDLRQRIKPLCYLFTHLTQVTGLVFSPYCTLATDGTAFKEKKPLYSQDLIELPGKVKAMHIMAYSIGVELYCATLYKRNKERKRLCNMAIEHIQPVLRSVPNDGRSLCLMALHLNMLRDRKEAQRYYERAIQAAPNNPRIWTHYAWFSHTAVEEMDRAEEYYKKALSLDENHPRALGDYAYFQYKKRGNLEAAMELFEKCITVAPTYKQGFADYAHFLKHVVGDKQKGKKIYKQMHRMPGLVIVFGKVSADPEDKTFQKKATKTEKAKQDKKEKKKEKKKKEKETQENVDT